MKIEWHKAPDIKKKIITLLEKTGVGLIDINSIYCYRSTGAKTRAIARIWGLAKLWQMTLNQKPSYIIEVISERFDKLSDHEKDKVLLHELAHIPKNFSGSLVPHIRRGKRSFRKKVDTLIDKLIYENNRRSR